MSETQTGRNTCYICGEGNRDILETHHIVPRRFDGSDDAENLVDLCPSCHRAIERLYGKRFYDELGVSPAGEELDYGECCKSECRADATRHITGHTVDTYTCEEHSTCDHNNCTKLAGSAHPANGMVTILCDSHAVCQHDGCASQKTMVVLRNGGPGFFSKKQVYCSHDHIPEDTDNVSYEVTWDE